MSKTAIVVFSDPKSGSEEALGRLFNALFVAYALKGEGKDVSVIFQGTGVRWASELKNHNHPAHALYNAVSDKVVGVCGGCADVFGATEDVEKTDLELVRELEIPGTNGVLNLSKYIENNYKLLIF